MTQIEMFTNEKLFFKQSLYIFSPIGLAMYVKRHDHCALNVCDRKISFKFGKLKCAHTNNMKTVENIK